LVVDEDADEWHVLNHLLASLFCVHTFDVYNESGLFLVSLLDGSIVESDDLPLSLPLLHDGGYDVLHLLLRLALRAELALNVHNSRALCSERSDLGNI
jgi:hypothetical protein